jgi:hypothetical protein
LHNQYTKTQVQKTLTQLVADEALVCKVYGKQSVYCIKQDAKENAPTQQELDQYDQMIKDNKEKLQALKEKYKELQSGKYRI